MKTQSVTSQNFTAKKFRLPLTLSSKYGDLKVAKGSYVMEYSNPKAESLYKKALKAGKKYNFAERQKLYSQMGEYDIVCLETEKEVDEFLYGSGILGKIRKRLNILKVIY